MSPKPLLLLLLLGVVAAGTLHPQAPAPEAEPVSSLDAGAEPADRLPFESLCAKRSCIERLLVPQRQAADPAPTEPTGGWVFPLWWGVPLLLAGLVGKLWVIGPGLLSMPLVQPLRWFLLVPLYSRISNAALFENPVRKRVSAYVRANPGATIMEVRNAVGIAWGTAVYHLERLERSGELVGERRGNHHRYFQANTPEARQRVGLSTLQQPNAYNLARAIAENPGIHQKGLCDGLGLNNPAASKHLRKLRDAGLVQAHRISRYVVYEPTDRLHSTLDLMADGPGGPGPDAPAAGLPVEQDMDAA